MNLHRHKRIALAAVTLLFIVTVAAAANDRLPAAGKAADAKAPPAQRIPRVVPPSQMAAADDAAYKQSVLPIVQKYCVVCHSGPKPPNGVNLTVYPDAASVVHASDLWQKVADNVESQRMPPAGMPRPTTAEVQRLVSWTQTTLSHANGNFVDPGRVTLHRLNREEYNNTVDDLLHLDLRPADAFPSDDVGYGFDNIADVLSLSPLLLEKYLSAAELLAHAAIIAPESLGATTRFGPSDFVTPGTQPSLTAAGDWLLYTNGQVGVQYRFPFSGTYVIRVRAYGEQAGPAPARMAIQFDGRDVSDVDVPQTIGAPGLFSAKVDVPAGEHRVGVAFLNDYYDPTFPDPNRRDRNLVVAQIAVDGPLTMPTPLPASETALIAAWPKNRAQYDICARTVLKSFASRAFRRPVGADELNRLVAIFHQTCAEGSSYQHGIQIGVEAILVSPNFLFRIELDPKPNDPRAVHAIDNYELASRLSYFLWSSMPDAELFHQAALGRLQKPAVLNYEVARMLHSPKSAALATNFAAQWLELRKLATAAPDPKQFPDFDDALRSDMREEPELYFENIVAQNRSILEFLDSDYTFLNQALARLYGIPGVEGDQFRLVHLTDRNRGGVLTMAGVLTVTSNPTRTSPVKRGRWVLEQILGTPPPPPPPGVPQLADGSQGPLTGTLRERMIEHRRNPACAACHQTMDPIGFGLENFNAVGAWRTTDSGLPIDASGTLPDGSSFNGPAQLKQILMGRKAQFVRAFSEKMLIYALGRGLTQSDRVDVDKIAAETTHNGYRFTSLIAAIVDSPPFRERRGDGGTDE